MKKTVFLLIALSVLLSSCTIKIDLEQEKQNMMQTDIDFSNRSVEKGFHQAFIDYAANNVVLLKPNSNPITGIEALKESYIGKSDSTIKLTWMPSYAKIAKSGELGYTYGIWTAEILTGENKGATSQGTYATIWEKNEKGEWKFVLDTGNDGLKPESNEQ